MSHLTYRQIDNLHFDPSLDTQNLFKSLSESYPLINPEEVFEIQKKFKYDPFYGHHVILENCRPIRFQILEESFKMKNRILKTDIISQFIKQTLGILSALNLGKIFGLN